MVYHQDIQQGNLIDETALSQVSIGQTREAVQAILGAPIMLSPFHANRWDYVYYFKSAQEPEPTVRRVVLFFKEDKVATLETY